jgi:hypothetical protein
MSAEETARSVPTKPKALVEVVRVPRTFQAVAQTKCVRTIVRRVITEKSLPCRIDIHVHSEVLGKRADSLPQQVGQIPRVENTAVIATVVVPILHGLHVATHLID